MKINILFEITEKPFGGGNQFLKALKKEFKNMGVYEDDIEKADVLLFNSFPFDHLEYFEIIKNFKWKKKLVFHRLDGPISLVRGFDKEVDNVVFKANEIFADGTIFQSRWIKDESEKMGLAVNPNYTVILNAPDRQIFKKTKRHILPNEKVRLIAVSWSPNIRKGFDVYEWLDTNLDFSKYEMSFVGNSPIEFKNIKQKPAMTSAELAEELNKHHIIIYASKFEPCSNALTEALHCGLPAIAYNNGGNPDIVGKGGELFKENSEIFYMLELVVSNYEKYVDSIYLPSISQVAQMYYDFMLDVYFKTKSGYNLIKKVDNQNIRDFNENLSINNFQIQIQKKSILSFINLFK
ncbi:MAG: glycosyltransferase [Bacteroidota bacterium]